MLVPEVAAHLDSAQVPFEGHNRGGEGPPQHKNQHFLHLQWRHGRSKPGDALGSGSCSGICKALVSA